MDDPRQLFDLTGRVACVTGASAGLGQRAAITLAAAGARVVGVARRVDALSDWAARTGTNAAAVAADLSQRDRLGEIAARISAPFGAPDIVVHAAGINTREAADNVTPEGWDVTMNLNLAAPFFMVHMLQRLGLELWVVMALTLLSQATNVMVLRHWGEIADRIDAQYIRCVSASVTRRCNWISVR